MAVRWIGTTLRETLDALQGPHFGANERPARPIKLERLHAYFRIAVSLLALGFGASILLTTTSGEIQSFGTGLIGTVVGYWLK